MPTVTTWMDLEGIMLSDISQTKKKKNKNHMISLRVACKASKQKRNKTKQNKTALRYRMGLPEERAKGVQGVKCTGVGQKLGFQL